MFIKEIENFNLHQIAQSGQCFRMLLLSSDNSSKNNAAYQVISQNNYLEVYQSDQIFTFNCPDNQNDFWLHYFDINTDYASFINAADPCDSYLYKASHYGRGIRILRQDPWEMILTFIISQQKTIPKIREAVELLSRHYGTRLTVTLPVLNSHDPCISPCSKKTITYYTFPTPEQLSCVTEEDLRNFKLGYRSKYIFKAVMEACQNTLDLNYLQTLTYDQAMAYLTGFFGIGEKVANCICLFGLHHIDAFPIDTWIQRILLKEYYQPEYEELPKNKLYQTIVQDNFSKYSGFRGVMQQYIFFYERSISGKEKN